MTPERGKPLETVFEAESDYQNKLKTLEWLYPNVAVAYINDGISGDNATHGVKMVKRDF